MKSIKPYVTGVLAVVLLTLTCISSHAFVGPTNFFAYNFDNSTQAGIFGNWFGGDYVTNAWDSSQDSSNNSLSGALELEVIYNKSQYVLWDGATPSYSGLPLTGFATFTNLEWDIMYSSATIPQIRTNASGGPMDFGNARIGSREPSYAQDWYFYYTVPATNSSGNPNNMTWVHLRANLSGVPTAFPGLAASGLVNTMFAQDDNAFGNNVLSGTQLIWYDNVFYTGWISPVPPPVLAIQKTTPGLQLFGGTGQYGRSELQITTNYLNDGWIGTGTTYPVTYSFTLASNGGVPGGLDTHLTFLPAGTGQDTPEGNSGADYQQEGCLWLQFVSGNSTNTACVANFSWKTNASGSNPNSPTPSTNGGVVLWFTNSVRAGTWTVEFDSAITGKITPPGSNNLTGNSFIPFDLSNPNPGAMPGGNVAAPALSSAAATANFSNPIYVRFGIMNYGNPANSPNGDQWNSISVSGTAGTNFNIDFTHQGYSTNSAVAGLDTTLWDLTSTDGGAINTVQVPTNAPYWVTWNTPDAGWNNLVTSTNLNGPWSLVEAYNNSYADGTNNLYVVPTQGLHNGVKWNLMLPQYLPTADGDTNLGPLSKTAFFRLTTNTNRPAGSP